VVDLNVQLPPLVAPLGLWQDDTATPINNKDKKIEFFILLFFYF